MSMRMAVWRAGPQGFGVGVGKGSHCQVLALPPYYCRLQSGLCISGIMSIS